MNTDDLEASEFTAEELADLYASSTDSVPVGLALRLDKRGNRLQAELDALRSGLANHGTNTQMNLDRLNRIAEDPTAFGSVSPGLFMELLDYARERAAREACEAAAEPLNAGLLCLIAGVSGLEPPWMVSVILPSGLQASGSGSTPTAAYLALLKALGNR